MDPWNIMYWGGRILFTMLFIMMGILQLTQADKFAKWAAEKNLPAAKAGVIITGLMILGGGVMVLIWWKPLWGAGLIGTFLILSAFTIHNFWAVSEEADKMNQMAHFMKNMSLAGACALIGVLAHMGGYWYG